tara:strand:- start:421 stop:939 length:519 start_codon:yes stop_codon:yes gene_type:complete
MDKQSIGKDYLTSGTKRIFLEALGAGKSKHEIIIMLGLDPRFGSNQYNNLLKQTLFEVRNRVGFLTEENLRKTEPYYENEDDYIKIPKYKMSELSKGEMLFYLKMDKKMAMRKIDRFKVDVLLHMNAVVMSNLGTDSTKEETVYVKSIVKENNRKIKDIDKEFFKTIDDGER